MRNKRGQMKMSFGMIFSIILIVFFIAFAFFAIKKFLDTSNDAEIGVFKNNLQNDINKIWKGAQASQEVEYFLPNKIKEICFVDDDYENLVFEGETYYSGTTIQHIDIVKITEDSPRNRFCILTRSGKVKMTLKKSFSESLVTIVRQ